MSRDARNPASTSSRCATISTRETTRRAMERRTSTAATARKKSIDATSERYLDIVSSPHRARNLNTDGSP